MSYYPIMEGNSFCKWSNITNIKGLYYSALNGCNTTITFDNYDYEDLM